MLGIDVYDRYQDITDWPAVHQHGVRFVYTKASDGGGPAAVRADSIVSGARSVGLPIGGYHYAQLSPSPETQADVLHTEVRRLGATSLPPALDLEGPFHTAELASAVSFAKRFLSQLRAHGYPQVTLYANTSFLSRLQPDGWGVPGLVIWAANYGINDGTRHGYSYTGRVDIHQYTDRGRVPGITNSVDLNESLTDIAEPDMNPEEVWKFQTTNVIDRNAGAAGVWAQDRLSWIDQRTFTIQQTLTQVLSQLQQIGNVDVDENALAAALGSVIQPMLRSILDEAIDEHAIDLSAEARDLLAGDVVRRLGERLAKQ